MNSAKERGGQKQPAPPAPEKDDRFTVPIPRNSIWGLLHIEGTPESREVLPLKDRMAECLNELEDIDKCMMALDMIHAAAEDYGENEAHEPIHALVHFKAQLLSFELQRIKEALASSTLTAKEVASCGIELF